MMQPEETSESSAWPMRGVFGEHELCRRILALVGADGPVLIVEIEDGRDRDQIHVGFVVGFERADVAPVERFFFLFSSTKLKEKTR